ncbi:MAG TPA: peptidylprolyl isomerase [Streptosporangiaceae bacterium]|nr:peptidylprolyl isomerase [Streptosporangiaceae bacterium]
MAGKKERQRRLARERYERNLSRRVAQQERNRRITGIILACLVVAGLGVGGFFLFGGGPANHPAAATPSRPATSPASTPSASTSPSAAAPVAEPAHTCAYNVSGTASRKVSLPPKHPDYKAHYQATIRTNRGNIVIALLNGRATCTVNSFVSLARQKYFSQTTCHRLTTSGIFVLQCGDPTGTGSGGPGYQFSDENLTGAKYPEATVAMANAGPNTNGSQFFLVYQNSTGLQPNYTPFGTIVSGLKIIQNVAKAGSDNANGAGDGHPKEKVVIKSVTIKKT